MDFWPSREMDESRDMIDAEDNLAPIGASIEARRAKLIEEADSGVIFDARSEA